MSLYGVAVVIFSHSLVIQQLPHDAEEISIKKEGQLDAEAAPCPCRSPYCMCAVIFGGVIFPEGLTPIFCRDPPILVRGGLIFKCYWPIAMIITAPIHGFLSYVS